MDLLSRKNPIPLSFSPIMDLLSPLQISFPFSFSLSPLYSHKKNSSPQSDRKNGKEEGYILPIPNPTILPFEFEPVVALPFSSPSNVSSTDNPILSFSSPSDISYTGTQLFLFYPLDLSSTTTQSFPSPPPLHQLYWHPIIPLLPLDMSSFIVNKSPTTSSLFYLYGPLHTAHILSFPSPLQIWTNKVPFSLLDLFPEATNKPMRPFLLPSPSSVLQTTVLTPLQNSP